MNKRKILLLSASLAGAAAVILLLVALLSGGSGVKWPDFPQPQGAEPQVVVVVEPDFGYHIGDVVPVDIYVRQPQGTHVNVDAMALEGDFEVRGEPEITSDQHGADVYIRYRVKLQSFQAFKPAYTAKISMTYEKPGDRNSYEVKAPSITVGTSNTWDGRDQNQEGPLAPWYGHHLLWAIAYLAVGLVGFIVSWVAVVRIRRGIPKPKVPATPLTPRQKAKLRFDRVWKKIRAGDQSEANFRVIDVIVRKLERIEHVLLEYVPIAVGDSHPKKAEIVYILTECEKVIFRGGTLSEGELDALEAMFNTFIGATPVVPVTSKTEAGE